MRHVQALGGVIGGGKVVDDAQATIHDGDAKLDGVETRRVIAKQRAQLNRSEQRMVIIMVMMMMMMRGLRVLVVLLVLLVLPPLAGASAVARRGRGRDVARALNESFATRDRRASHPPPGVGVGVGGRGARARGAD